MIEWVKKGLVHETSFCTSYKICPAFSSKAGNEETAKLIQERGGEVHAYQCDVSDNEEVTRTAKLSRRDVGANVDILINNAGVMPCKELLDLSEEEIRRTIGVNTLAHFWVGIEIR